MLKQVFQMHKSEVSPQINIIKNCKQQLDYSYFYIKNNTTLFISHNSFKQMQNNLLYKICKIHKCSF